MKTCEDESSSFEGDDTLFSLFSYASTRPFKRDLMVKKELFGVVGVKELIPGLEKLAYHLLPTAPLDLLLHH